MRRSGFSSYCESRRLHERRRCRADILLTSIGMWAVAHRPRIGRAARRLWCRTTTIIRVAGATAACSLLKSSEILQTSPEPETHHLR
jgi:hypothetical protein